MGVAALPDAVVFLDTNIFTTENMDESAWDALFTKAIFITPGVWNELLPWLKTPFRNKRIRDRVIAAVQNQVRSQGSNSSGASNNSIPKMEVLFVDKEFTDHGYQYYLNLLALRKMMGPLAVSVLTKKLGRKPTSDEFLAEIQGRFGSRGFRIAKKGLEAEKSPNKLTDEQLVVMAVLTAIIRGKETFIVTRDADVLEQYFKVLSHMKEHYRAMHVAERYAANPKAMPFREIPIHSDGVHIPEFSGSSVLRFETTDIEFNPLPTRFSFVNIYCLLLGGGSADMKITYSSFCAETEMAQMLKVKSATGGLSTDKLDGRNCTIRTERLTPENHKVIVSIGKERAMSFGKSNSFSVNDVSNTLFENEEVTRLSYDNL